MPTKCNRYMVTVREEMYENLNHLKKEQYYNKPQSEMLRQLLEIGIQVKLAELAGGHGHPTKAG